VNVKRYYIPNAIVFITQVVDRRTPVFRDAQYVELLRTILNNVKEIHPFVTLGYVFLYDHFHLLIRPTGASTFSDILHSLKPNFTKEYKKLIGVDGSMRFWQKSFWDHIIRDEVDFQRHLDYIHYNPVRHGLVEKPEDWLHSSFRHWQERDAYPTHWGWSLPASIAEYEWQSSEDDNNE
jgi:putative transposase